MAKPPPDITGRYPDTPTFGHPRFLPWLTDREAAERAAEKLLHRIAVLEAELASERAKKPERPALHCSFCAKSQHDVTKLIAGPNNFICNECVALCVDIICGKEKP